MSNHMQQLRAAAGGDPVIIFDLGLVYIIETLEQEGSVIYSKKAKRYVKLHFANQLVGQTGAGGQKYGLAN